MTFIDGRVKQQVKEFTVNCAQAAGTYDLCTATGGDIVIHDMNFPVTVSGATFTSVAIQTNDAVPWVIMTAIEGAVANIIAGTNLQPANKGKSFTLVSGKKIQYTLVGSTGTGTILVPIYFSPAGSTGTLQ